MSAFVPRKLTGRRVSGNRRLDSRAADRALPIIRDRYADFGPTLACEKSAEDQPRCITVGIAHLYSSMPAVAVHHGGLCD
ncbi:hypothetical protein [Burkholderia ambifaria]|uniref:hypothetical protein n=1 Tax=Burkholderia ambifaria TaxID=152480 RepID=UPI00158AAAFA|nr:hypothetical protein [Burkholderia ambifaria]